MESNGKVIAITGSRGKLAPFVMGALGTAGFRIATDKIVPYPLDLESPGEATYLVDKWRERFGAIDGLVALTGSYVLSGSPQSFASVMHANVMPIVNVIAELLRELSDRDGSVIAIDAADGGLWPKEAGYRAGKAALDAYLRSLSFEHPRIDVSYVRPSGPIDTDEKRSGLAAMIVSLLKRESTHSHA